MIISRQPGLVIVRDTSGSGGWSLHTPKAIEIAKANGDLPEIVLSGPAEWDEAKGDWNRPDADDISEAHRRLTEDAVFFRRSI